MKMKELAPGMEVAVKVHGDRCVSAIVVQAPLANYRTGNVAKGETRVGIARKGSARYAPLVKVEDNQQPWYSDDVKAFQIVSTWDEYEAARQAKVESTQRMNAAREARTAESHQKATELLTQLEEAGFEAKIDRTYSINTTIFEVVVTGVRQEVTA